MSNLPSTVMSNPNETVACNHCDDSQYEVKICPCTQVLYCVGPNPDRRADETLMMTDQSRRCQKADWPRHRKDCLALNMRGLVYSVGPKDHRMRYRFQRWISKHRGKVCERDA